MPNITVTGRTRSGATSLHTLAEESVQRLTQTIGPVRVVKRAEVGTSEAPGLVDAPGIVQNLYIDAVVNGQPMELAQSQFLLLVENERQPSERAEVEIALTVRSSQLQEMLPDYQDFLRTVRPATPEDLEDGRE